MLSFVRAFRVAATVLLAVTAFAAAPAKSYAQGPGVGSVRLHIVKAGFIIGVGGGSGVLHFRGHNYPLSVGGIGLGSLGVAAVDLVGTASNLHSPYDILGTYGGAGAGGSFVGGGQVATLQNERGVVLRLQGVQAGFQVSLGLGGMLFFDSSTAAGATITNSSGGLVGFTDSSTAGSASTVAGSPSPTNFPPVRQSSRVTVAVSARTTCSIQTTATPSALTPRMISTS